MAVEQILEAQLIERELIDVDFVERELIKVTLSVVDVIGGRKTVASMEDVDFGILEEDEIMVQKGGKWKNKTVSAIIDTYAVHNEVPTPAPPVLTSEKYTTAYAYRPETLEVFLNGVKLYIGDVTQHSDTEFSISIDSIISDKITVNYIKK